MRHIVYSLAAFALVANGASTSATVSPPMAPAAQPPQPPQLPPQAAQPNLPPQAAQPSLPTQAQAQLPSTAPDATQLQIPPAGASASGDSSLSGAGATAGAGSAGATSSGSGSAAASSGSGSAAGAASGAGAGVTANSGSAGAGATATSGASAAPDAPATALPVDALATTAVPADASATTAAPVVPAVLVSTTAPDTTAAPDTTTAAPDTTTAAPDTTTAAPDTTTAAPDTTTAAPDTTTAAPDTTTAAPDTTTAAPDTTTAAPDTTTASPDATTTASPAEATAAPDANRLTGPTASTDSPAAQTKGALLPPAGFLPNVVPAGIATVPNLISAPLVGYLNNAWVRNWNTVWTGSWTGTLIGYGNVNLPLLGPLNVYAPLTLPSWTLGVPVNRYGPGWGSGTLVYPAVSAQPWWSSGQRFSWSFLPITTNPGWTFTNDMRVCILKEIEKRVQIYDSRIAPGWLVPTTTGATQLATDIAYGNANGAYWLSWVLPFGAPNMPISNQNFVTPLLSILRAPEFYSVIENDCHIPFSNFTLLNKQITYRSNSWATTGVDMTEPIVGAAPSSFSLSQIMAIPFLSLAALLRRD